VLQQGSFRAQACIEPAWSMSRCRSRPTLPSAAQSFTPPIALQPYEKWRHATRPDANLYSVRAMPSTRAWEQIPPSRGWEVCVGVGMGFWVCTFDAQDCHPKLHSKGHAAVFQLHPQFPTRRDAGEQEATGSEARSAHLPPSRALATVGSVQCLSCIGRSASPSWVFRRLSHADFSSPHSSNG
jgi:hypothetical protein